MTEATHDRAQFHHMKDGTAADWAVIATDAKAFSANLYRRIMDHMMLLKDDCGGFPVDRLTHCLQTATLAHKVGKDEEYVVCALLHDIGDTLGPSNHADLAATILQPYVSEANHWMIKHHGIFQGYYFFEYLGLDRNLRDQFKDHPQYARTMEFIEAFDAPAFNPATETYPLSFFEPMLQRVLAKPQRSLYMSDKSNVFE